MRAPPQYPWYEIPEAVWERVAPIADRHQERTQAEGEVWRENSNLVGILGEWCYGLLRARLDLWQPERFYDGGIDFPGVNVKATASQNARYLLANSYGGLKTPFYFAVTIDLDRRMAHPLGYATRKQMQHGGGADLGFGRRRGVTMHELLSADEILGMFLDARYGGEAT